MGLTALYLGIGTIVVCLIAKVRGKKPSGKNAENTWFWVLLGAAMVTFVIHCSGPVLGLFVPEKFHEKKEKAKSFLRDFWTDETNAPAISTKPPLSPTRKTRFWLKAATIYLSLAIPFGCWAYSDDVAKMLRAVADFFRKRREEKGKHQPHEGHSHSNVGPTGHSFGELFKADFLVEGLFRALEWIFKGRRK